jgi:hypothetical protein
VPFIRCARDKRGYDATYVMHIYRPGQGNSKTRILYFFRSPAHIKVGRRVLEPEVMEALEHTHPDLNFDWTTLNHERDAAHDRSERFERADRGDRNDRPRYDRNDRSRDRRDSRESRPAPRPVAPAEPTVHPRQVRDVPIDNGEAQPAAEPPAPPAPAVSPDIPDDSLLARTVGASRAANLRMRYADILQRIARRARSAEDGERLNARAKRLNPDDWVDPTAVLAASQTVDGEWDAILSELPGRRRGRRGGRNRGHRPDPGPSVIIESGQGDGHADVDEVEDEPAGGPADFAGGAVAVRADAAEPADAGDTPGTTDVPGGRESH